MLTDIRLRNPIPDTRWCCVVGCKDESATILGENSALPAYYNLRRPVGICGEHWDVYYGKVEQPKAAMRARMKRAPSKSKRAAVAIARAPELVEEEFEDEFEEDELEEEYEEEAPPPRKKRMKLRIRRR